MGIRDVATISRGGTDGPAGLLPRDEGKALMNDALFMFGNASLLHRMIASAIGPNRDALRLSAMQCRAKS